MSAFSKINEEEKVSEEISVEKFLTPELCEDAGIIVINNKDGILDLGAMNLAYSKVKNVIYEIENKFGLKVNLKQITSLEWETWFENTHSLSVETIQKNTTQKRVEEIKLILKMKKILSIQKMKFMKILQKIINFLILTTMKKIFMKKILNYLMTRMMKL